ncbi:50S ribosomal protein L32 [Bacteroidia bacterium]|nr:50S ribosomal protein L32 [Candidatus Symbiothrix dinenymphae]GHT24416.1 50S ribosomal protein L32 [Bacteroidia bacterium]GHT40573.1 50S ribosomal protein L32 [Bacteroidia bacterium]GHT49883.1 50S ribosomal protein L32 [Bacteroidia bacterium]
MAHPKRRVGKTRRDKRRTHDNAVLPQIALDQTTGEYHLYHRAHWHEGKLFYKGKVIIDKAAVNE